MSVAVWRERREGDGKGGTWEEEGGVGGGTEECERRRWGGASINQCPPPKTKFWGDYGKFFCLLSIFCYTKHQKMWKTFSMNDFMTKPMQP